MQQHEIREKIIQQLLAIYDKDESDAIAKTLLDFYSGDPVSRIEYAVIRLLENEPLQYVLGEAWFYDLPFYVDKNVLIPRPETEELVHLVLNDLTGLKPNSSMLDIGTGSGCIPVSIKKNRPDTDVYAMDISAEALALAKQNATRNRAEVYFFQADILRPVTESPLGRFNMIVSNPPYITEEEKHEMHNNVLQYEPHLALFVTDRNPLQFYEAISGFAANHLTPGGKLYVEINAAYGKEVKICLENNGFIEVIIFKDMQGKDRIVSGMLPG
jgi:release factor glutamine methyltransferase